GGRGRGEAAEGSADEARLVAPRLVQRALERIDELRPVGVYVERWTAGMPGQRGREHFVPPLERRQRELPRPPCVEEPVDAEERRPRAAAVEPREHRRQYPHGPPPRERLEVRQPAPP